MTQSPKSRQLVDPDEHAQLIPAEVRERLLRVLEESEIDTVVAHTYGAIRNLTGGWYSFNYSDFSFGADRQYVPWLVVDRKHPDDPLYLCSHLERNEAVLIGHPIGDIADPEYGAGFAKSRSAESLAHALVHRGLDRGRIGLELEFLPAPALDALRRGLPNAQIVDAHPALLNVRAVKTGPEIEALRSAATVTEEALRAVFASAREGVDDVALERSALRAIGAAGATPVQRYYLLGIGPGHKRHGAGNLIGQKLQVGDVLLVDLGLKVDGMHGDLVRLGCIGGAPSFPVGDAIALATAVNAEVAAFLRPGLSQREAFAEAGRMASGHGSEVAPWGRPLPLHHGLGWSLYEPPFDLSWHGAEELDEPPRAGLDPYGVLETGMVFSLETAVVSPDGTEMYCNIEDPYVLTADGCERLNTMPPDLILCGEA